MTAAETIAAIRADARFAKATETLAAEHERTVQDLITLTEIPAPPFNESRNGTFSNSIHFGLRRDACTR